MRLARDPAVPLRGGAHLRADAWPAFATDTAPLGRRRAADGSGGERNLRQSVCQPLCLWRGLCRHGRGLHGQGAAADAPGGAVLHGTDVTAPDLRGGAALLAAALAADGETRLRDPGHIPRGYENLPAALRGLGAEIS